MRVIFARWPITNWMLERDAMVYGGVQPRQVYAFVSGPPCVTRESMLTQLLTSQMVAVPRCE
jgi:hypothetical protein